MIRCDLRRKSFGATDVLRDIVFEVQRGETVAVLGPSGIGKSTLLRIIAGLDPAYEGSVYTGGRIAMVFQEPLLLPWRSAEVNVALVHPGLTTEAARAALNRVGIADRAALFPRQVSLGQQRRVALARAFAGDPAVLLMDEPFASLDEATADDMLALTERLIAESRPATVFVTHSGAEAARLANRVLRLAGRPATVEGGR